MSDQIEMPTPCIDCGGIWDLNSLYWDMRCPECHRNHEEGDDGSE